MVKEIQLNMLNFMGSNQPVTRSEWPSNQAQKGPINPNMQQIIDNMLANQGPLEPGTTWPKTHATRSKLVTLGQVAPHNMWVAHQDQMSRPHSQQLGTPIIKQTVPKIQDPFPISLSSGQSFTKIYKRHIIILFFLQPKASPIQPSLGAFDSGRRTLDTGHL